jgi:glucose/arabinose dehydrogenase
MTQSASVFEHEAPPRDRLARVSLVALAAFAVGGTAIGGASPAPRALAAMPTRITVTLTDFRIRMSRAVSPRGQVVFQVTNKGAVVHDLVFANGGRTRLLEPGGKQTMTVTFSKAGTYRFFCSVSGHRALGMQGTLRIGSAEAPPKKPPAPSGGDGTTNSVGGKLRLTRVATGLGPLTYVVAPPGDPARLMVVRQDGLVLLSKDGVVQETPFLDLRSVVHADGEKGLLSIAFAPDYATSGLLYAYYNDLDGNVRVVELRRSDDPDVAFAAGRELLFIPEPTANHNGGMMQFGPDGYLYIAVGDGGANPPAIPVGAFGQTLDNLLGTILRIDPRKADPYGVPAGNPFVSTPGVRPEIVAFGLRNPWRFWIDSRTNTMLIGDVGEGAREEIDRLPLDRLGLNFGWPCKEGTVTPPEVLIPASCATATLTRPLYEYAHSASRCSITGGVVSRDTRLPTLAGLYLWSDLCSGQLFAINPAGGTVTERPLGLSVKEPTSFGTDAHDRVYVTSYAGSLYRLDPA